MKNFLAIYLGTPAALEKSGWNELEDSARRAREAQGMQAWTDWAQQHATAIVEQGSPLGKTKRADKSGIKDTSNDMAAWTIVQAESHDAAVKLFENHPHFTIFPGDAVEIMECLPIPGM